MLIGSPIRTRSGPNASVAETIFANRRSGSRSTITSSGCTVPVRSSPAARPVRTSPRSTARIRMVSAKILGNETREVLDLLGVLGPADQRRLRGVDHHQVLASDGADRVVGVL